MIFPIGGNFQPSVVTPALFAFTVALFVVSRREIGSLRILGGGVFIGGGIAGLHYTAMGPHS